MTKAPAGRVIDHWIVTTSELSEGDRIAVRALLDRAFDGDFSDDGDR